MMKRAMSKRQEREKIRDGDTLSRKRVLISPSSMSGRHPELAPSELSCHTEAWAGRHDRGMTKGEETLKSERRLGG